MKKAELKQRTEKTVSETRDALQAVYDSLNSGQKSKLLKLDDVKNLFDRYDVKY